MSQYSVVATDGQLYGPADETVLVQWAREGRINAQTALHCHQTNQRLWAQSVPSLAPLVGLPQPVVHQLAQPQAYQQQPVQPYGQPQAYAQPQGYARPVAYAQPGGYAAAAGHQLTEFSPGLMVLLHFLTSGIFPMIHFGLMHDRLPKNRPDDPSAGKAIGFLFIPFFNVYWTFFHHLRLVDRVNEQRMLVGLPPGGQKNLFIWGMVCIFASIPLFFVLIGFLTIIAGAVLLVVFQASLQGSVNELVQRTRGYGR